MKRAYIFDLDNTIYPVSSIGDELFQPLFEKLEASGKHNDDMEGIRKDVMRIPFQAVIEKYGIEDDLAKECIELLKTLEYNGPMQPFEDFAIVRSLPVDKFVVTTGFIKMQQAKVKALKLNDDFKDVFIVDPETSDKKKKDLFVEIMEKYGYKPEEVLVIGDDPDNEIKGATELGIDTVLYDKSGEHMNADATYKIRNYSELKLKE